MKGFIVFLIALILFLTFIFTDEKANGALKEDNNIYTIYPYLKNDSLRNNVTAGALHRIANSLERLVEIEEIKLKNDKKE